MLDQRDCAEKGLTMHQFDTGPLRAGQPSPCGGRHPWRWSWLKAVPPYQVPRKACCKLSTMYPLVGLGDPDFKIVSQAHFCSEQLADTLVGSFARKSELPVNVAEHSPHTVTFEDIR